MTIKNPHVIIKKDLIYDKTPDRCGRCKKGAIKLPKRLNKNYILSALRSFLLLTVFCFSSTLSGFAMRNNVVFQKHVQDFWNEQLYSKVNFYYSLFIFFSLASVFWLNQIYLKKSFLSENNRSGKIRFIFTSPYVWIEFAMISVCAFIFTLLPPFSDLIKGYFNVGYSLWAKRLFCLLISIPTLLTLDFLACLSTLNWWTREKKKKKTEAEKHPIVSFLVQLCSTVALWILGGYAIYVVVPMLYSLWPIIKVVVIAFFGLLLAVLAFWIGSRYMRIIHARRSLIKRLKVICKEKGSSLSLNGHPYRSAFYPDEGHHLLLQNGRSTIACRFISSPKNKTPLYLYDDGIATYAEDMVVAKYYVSEKYFFNIDGNAQKIIIVCPCRGKIFLKREDDERSVDVGDKVMEYKIYNSSGFLNAIERECL